MLKAYRIKRLKIMLAGLQGEYDELLRIFGTLENHNHYHIDKMTGLKKLIAEYAQTLEQLEG